MPKPIQHPTDNELSAFALGDLPLDVAEKVERHVSECHTCCDTIISLASDDTFVGQLQHARADEKDSKSSISNRTTSEVDDQIPLPLQTHSRYEIKMLVGRGGMGRVYKARHRMMDRDVALKVIHPEWVTKHEAIDRFRREMKSAASLDHPNIVTAHDAEQADDLHFLVMEYVDGIDLAKTVRQNGPLPVGQARELIRQVAEGLQHAHERGMVHRDIKPHNLIVTKDNVVKILDFGLASLAPQAASDEPISEDADGILTTAGAIMGTPDFISPEQAEDARAVDGRSDIYSLGMTLYYLLSGRLPFGEGNAAEKLRQHAESEPTQLSELRDDVPVELQNIVTRMTAKNPAARFQTPQEVAFALSQATDVPTADIQPVVEPKRSSGIRAAFKGGVIASALVLAVVAVLQFAGFFSSNTPLDEVHAPLGELESYVHSMMASPHDLVFLNVGDIGPDKNYVTFSPIQGGVRLRMPAFENHLGQNPQGESVQRFQKAAEAASLSVLEKSEFNKSGLLRGVNYSIDVIGDPQAVSDTITQVMAQAFSVQLTESCDYNYRNLPAKSSQKMGAGPQRVSGTEFVAKHRGGQQAYYGEHQNWIYLVPADRLTDEKMQRDPEVWYANINELPAGFASQIRSDHGTKRLIQRPYDFSNVPGNATQIIGCRPQQVFRDTLFTKLRERPLPIQGLSSLFVNENVTQFLNVTMPRQADTSQVYVVTIEDGSVMHFVEEVLGLKERPTSQTDSSQDNVLPYDATQHVARSGRTYVRRIDQKTAVIGTQQALILHQSALQASPNTEVAEFAKFMQGSALFAIADKMTVEESRQLIRWAEDFAFESSFKNLCTIGQNSDYFGASISLKEDPEIQFVSHAQDAQTQKVVAEKIRLVPEALRLLSELFSGTDSVDLDQEESDLVDAVLAKAATTSSGLNTHLTISLGLVKRPLLRLAENLLDTEQDQRRAAKLNLMQIALAFHSFHQVHGYLPSVETWLPQAQQPVSWRIAILPFLEQQELYAQYNLDEPWDSTNNRQLIEKMPAIFRHPSLPQQSTNASHVVFVGETATGTADQHVTFQEITDGTSGTIMVVEAATSIPWTKPEDLQFDLTLPLPSIGNLFRRGWYAAWSDGSVSFVPSTTSVDVVKALITSAGNDPVTREGETFDFARSKQAAGKQSQKANAASADVKNIVGTWQVTYAEDSGQVVPQEVMKNIQFSFTKDSLSGIGMGQAEQQPYRLDATTIPKSIDMTMEASHISLGIYDLQGDTLRLCIGRGKERPNQFDSSSESRNLILNLKRMTSTATKSDRFIDAIARNLLPEAASMPFRDFEKMGRSPVPPDPAQMASQSLTVFLLGLELTNKDAAKDFRYVSGMPKPSDLAGAITKTRWKGYASYIQPEYITACTAQINSENESEANGWVEFKAPELYEGKIHFTANKMLDGKWKIVEFTLPNVSVTLVLSEDGQWSKLTSEDSSDQE
ncbi:MAG: protein kinase [Fuerstiella sp.]